MRPRLLKQLNDSQDQRLIFVTAPAGFGKTTLVTSWLAQQPKKAAWVSLDNYDNDPHLFLSYIVAAMQRLETGACSTVVPLLESPEPPIPQILLTYLINDLACLQEPCILVLDDYHVVKSAEIHGLVDFLVDRIPNTLQIVITSRVTPAFSVSRLRAQNQLAEINAFDLRFNFEESRQFLNELMHLHLSESDIAILEQKTEGWVTGLQLAALGLKEQQIGSDFIQKLTGEDRFISDYLIEEVLAHQPAEVREFLVKTAVLKRLTAPLCNALLGINNSQSILLNLEKNNLFLIPLDNHREWYRYHHLFDELLLSRLELKSPEQIPILNQKASDWHQENGLTLDAIEYALEAQNYEKAISLIQNVSFSIQDSRRRTSFIRWTEQIPTELVQKSTFLWIQYILAEFYHSNFNKVSDFLERIGVNPPEKITDEPIPPDHAFAYPLLAALTLHTTLDANRVKALNRKALAILPRSADLMRGIAWGHFGSACLALGDIESAYAYLTDALNLIEKDDAWSVSLVFYSYLGEVIVARGELELAAAKFQEIRSEGEARGLHKGNTFSQILLGPGLLHYEWNELEIAENLIIEGNRLAETSTSIDRLLFGLGALVKLKICCDYAKHIDDKFMYIEKVAETYGSPPLVMERLAALQARLDLHEGKQQEALMWAEAFVRSHPEVTALQQIEWMIVARIWMACGKESECMQLLQMLQSLAREDNRVRDQIKLSAMQINLFVQLGEMELALSQLCNLLEQTESESYIRTFVDEGENMQRVLQIVWDGNGRFTTPPSSAYLKKILDAFPNQLQPAKEIIPSLLTPRETEILQLLSQGLSYAQMTQALTITDNTLKTHIKRIYSKLDVHNRVQAVLAAQETGLL